MQVGFNPLRILRKRNKALKKIKKLIKKGELTLTSVRPQVLKHESNDLKDFLINVIMYCICIPSTALMS